MRGMRPALIRELFPVPDFPCRTTYRLEFHPFEQGIDVSDSSKEDRAVFDLERPGAYVTG